MKRLLILTISLGLMSTAAIAAPVFTIEAPDLDGFDIDWFIWNDDPWVIDEVLFDLSTAVGPLGAGGMSFGSAFDEDGPDGGTSTLNFNPAFPQQFGFSFTSFDMGDHFEFGWDPDLIGDPSFGATNADLAGTTVTIFASGMAHVGVMERFFDPDTERDGLRAVIAGDKVPEPSTLALLALGTLGLALRRRG